MHRCVAILVLFLAIPASAYSKVNVLDHGAKADGQTDDTAAIQKALDSARKNRGSVVEMPKGLYRVDDHLVIPPGVCLLYQVRKIRALLFHGLCRLGKIDWASESHQELDRCLSRAITASKNFND